MATKDEKIFKVGTYLIVGGILVIIISSLMALASVTSLINITTEAENIIAVCMISSLVAIVSGFFLWGISH